MACQEESWEFVVLYRLHRLPHIGDNIHIQIGAKYYTKLDLGSGYWQVEMEEKDKAKTAFGVCNFGFYECNIWLSD